MKLFALLVATTSLSLSVSGPHPVGPGDVALPEPRATQDPEGPDFARDVRPILSRNCFACHGPDPEHRSAGLRLDTPEGATAKLKSGSVAVVPGRRDQSALWLRISHEEPERRMPPPKSGHELTADQREVLGRWIDAGGSYAPHWAFVKPARPPLPVVADSMWVRNAIDRFIRAKQERKGVIPQGEADPAILLRRVTLDLTGLPPTPEERAAFLADQGPDAYEKVVKRLLASPRYGERMARIWLDLARYADSTGYASDPLRRIWRWRDWVIDAFNANMPFDQFTIEQMAGDLLPNATTEQILATAFHRNTMTNTEGGTDDEEWRVAAVKDRIETTAQVWMGLTLGCAECHSHKFDPISHEEYYRFFAYFNQTADSDRPNDPPRARTPSPDQLAHIAKLEGELKALEHQLAVQGPAIAKRQAAWEDRVRRLKIPWTVLEPVTVTGTGGVRMRILDDQSVLADGPSPDKATYTLSAVSKLKGITGVRVEVLTHDALPGKGPGRSPGNGNLVLNHFTVTAQPIQPRPVSGRFVRIDLPGASRILSLAEVEVTSGKNNVAKGKPARQSSTDFGGPARFAVDGRTSGVFEDKTVTHTRTEADPWWEVDLGETTRVDRVAVWNRTGGNLERRLAGAVLRVLDDERKVVWETTLATAPRPSVVVDPASFAAQVPLRAASASFSQDEWEVARAIDGDRSGKTGWAIAPRQGQSHVAVFETATDIGDGTGTRLSFKLRQDYGGKHTLGRFRISVTNAPRPVAVLPDDVRHAIAVPLAKRTKEQKAAVDAHWRGIDPELGKVRAAIAAKQDEIKKAPSATTPILQELPPERRRKTYVLEKGNFLVKGKEVTPGTPAALHPMKKGGVDRLALAQWLVSPDNPLTARVMVNRLWAALFGRGLVETEEDFGSQGALPTHEGLLDWLAVEYMERGWDTKAMLELMVTSATYRQSARAPVAVREVDPDNRWLARAPRFRLDAETVRDQSLAFAGLLSPKLGGPSVFPPQPAGLWRAAFNGADRRWPESTGEDRYRRGIYTFIRRTAPYPALTIFDMPSREVCTPRRVTTNTPLQALVTLNDPAFVEAAQALARRLIAEGGKTDASRVRFGLRLVTGREPVAEQVAALSELLAVERKVQASDPKAAEALATVPLGALPEGLSAPEAAAWTVVANVLLNLDAVLTRG